MTSTPNTVLSEIGLFATRERFTRKLVESLALKIEDSASTAVKQIVSAGAEPGSADGCKCTLGAASLEIRLNPQWRGREDVEDTGQSAASAQHAANLVRLDQPANAQVPYRVDVLVHVDGTPVHAEAILVIGTKSDPESYTAAVLSASGHSIDKLARTRDAGCEGVGDWVRRTIGSNDRYAETQQTLAEAPDADTLSERWGAMLLKHARGA